MLTVVPKPFKWYSHWAGYYWVRWIFVFQYFLHGLGLLTNTSF